MLAAPEGHQHIANAADGNDRRGSGNDGSKRQQGHGCTDEVGNRSDCANLRFNQWFRPRSADAIAINKKSAIVTDGALDCGNEGKEADQIFWAVQVPEHGPPRQVPEPEASASLPEPNARLMP